MVTRIDVDAWAGARAGRAGVLRLGRLTAADRAFAAAYLKGLRRGGARRTGPHRLRSSCGRTEAGLVLESRIDSDRPSEVRLTVRRAGIQIEIADRQPNRRLFLRRLLDDQGVVWERIEAEEAPLRGLLRGVGKAHRLEKLDAIGAALPFLVGFEQAIAELRGLLPFREARALLVECAGEGIGHRSFVDRGGRRWVTEALEPLLFARRHALAAILGAPARGAFLKRVLRIAQEADGGGQPDAMILEPIREAFRRTLRGSAESPRGALVELIALLGEELTELLLLSRSVEQQQREEIAPVTARRDCQASRFDSVKSRVRRGLDRTGEAFCLERAVTHLESARSELHELRGIVSRLGFFREPSGSGRPPSCLIEGALSAEQVLLRISLCLRDRTPRSHEEIGRLVGQLADFLGTAQETQQGVWPARLRERWIALCAGLLDCGEELFEASLKECLREEGGAT